MGDWTSQNWTKRDGRNNQEQEKKGMYKTAAELAVKNTGLWAWKSVHETYFCEKKASSTRKKWAEEKILTCAKTFLSVTMVLQVPQDGKNFSGHMFIGLIVELEAKRTRPSKANKVHCMGFRLDLHYFAPWCILKSWWLSSYALISSSFTLVILLALIQRALWFYHCIQKWYFVTKIVLTYCEKKLF